MSTIQLDFNLPRRFELEYVGADNARHPPIMIHRALFGSVERFMAVLIEHYAGALPTWLSPEQVRVLPVSEDHAAYAESVRAACAGAGLRVSVDDAADNIGARIRKAKLTKVPYILVVGSDDVAAQTVGVNARASTGKPRRGVDLTTFVDDVVAEVARRGSPEDTAGESPDP
jgi:threonyl-tRNA synthetase